MFLFALLSLIVCGAVFLYSQFDYLVAKKSRDERQLMVAGEVANAEHSLSVLQNVSSGSPSTAGHESNPGDIQKALTDIKNSLDRIREMSAGNKATLRILDRIEGRLSAVFAEINQHELSVNAGSSEPGSQSSEELQESLTDIGTDFWAISQEEREALAIREAESRFETTGTKTIAESALLFVLTVIVWLGIDIRRDFLKNLTQWRSDAASANLANITDHAVVRTDLDGNVIAWNKGAERIFGYAAEEMLGRPIALLAPHGGRNEIERSLKTIRLGKDVERREEIRVAKGGQQLCISQTISPMRNAKGAIVGASAILRDISQQKWALESLRESEQHYRLLFESIPLPAWLFDGVTLQVIAANPAAIGSYGYSQDEFTAMRLFDVVSPEKVTELLYAVAHSGAPVTHMAAGQSRKKDGSLIDIEITASELNVAGNRALLILASDISERKRAEEQLRASEYKFATLFRSSPIAFALISEVDQSFLDVNEAFIRLAGYDRTSILCDRDTNQRMWNDSGSPKKIVELIRNNGSVHGFETRLNTAHGENRIVQIEAEQIEIGEQSVVLAVFYDITESRYWEQHLRHAQKMEAIGLLAGGIAHDYNNVLMVITSYAQLLKRKLERSDSVLTDHVETILDATNTAASVTKQLLAFSRQQTRGLETLDLNVVVLNFSKLLPGYIGDKIEMHVLTASAPCLYCGDRGQMEQVIMNLAANAKDAMPDGGLLNIEVSTIEVDDESARKSGGISPGNYVQLIIRDTGCGMDEPTKARIFEPFFTTKDRGKGTGLGLATVYGIVQQNKGFITVRSHPGEGTIVKVHFPAIAEKGKVQPLDKAG